eukprot:5269377-Prymnesium_polylepis.1
MITCVRTSMLLLGSAELASAAFVGAPAGAPAQRARAGAAMVIAPFDGESLVSVPDGVLKTNQLGLPWVDQRARPRVRLLPNRTPPRTRSITPASAAARGVLTPTRDARSAQSILDPPPGTEAAAACAAARCRSATGRARRCVGWCARTRSAPPTSSTRSSSTTRTRMC